MSLYAFDDYVDKLSVWYSVAMELVLCTFPYALNSHIFVYIFIRFDFVSIQSLR